MKSIDLFLPWPKRWVWPNSRCHWSQRASASKQMKAHAKLVSLSQGLGGLRPSSVVLNLDFHPPGRCDDDGCVSSFKAYRDGIAEVLGVDDMIFKLGKVNIIRPGKKPGWVRATLEMETPTNQA